ncbi:MAG: hypothetical protein Q4D32_08385, partial [Eubacteriales bacterium]|nr:hypothetical protein [Eubacteriales bacterium]
GEPVPAMDPVPSSNGLVGGTEPVADAIPVSNSLLGGGAVEPESVSIPITSQSAESMPESIPISISTPAPEAVAEPVAVSSGNSINPEVPMPAAVPTPMPSAVPTAVPTAAAVPSAPLPPELSQYLDEIKPKMQQIIVEWSQYSEEFVQKISNEQFSGFSDPKIKEYRDEIGNKQEDFGEELEEILENLNEHIEQIDSQGVAEDVMKSVLDQERECYSGLLDLKVNLETIGEVDYRISRRCSKNHEKWDQKYNSLPSVIQAVEEEKKNQERQRLASEIAMANEKIEEMTREYTDAKTTVEISQKGLESKQGNLEQDRQKLMVRAEAAISAVEDKIKENSNLIEELEVENKRLEDELKDAGSFALGRKRTIRDTIDYNTGFINKYKEVASNLEVEKEKVTEEWNKKLDDLVGDNDHLQALIQENTAKMQTLEQGIAAERQNVQNLQAELIKIQ